MTSGRMKGLEKMKNRFQKLQNEDDKSECGDEGLPVRINYVPPRLMEEAKTQLNESAEVRPKALAEFRKMIEGEQKLSTPVDDLFLLAFLRARKFNVKKAFKLLQNYWKFRTEYMHIYDFSQFEPVKELIMRNFLGFLQYRDRNGCIVFIAKVGQWNPELDSYEELFRAISAVLVYSIEHEATQIAGFRIIVDARGMSWTQLKYATPTNFLLMVKSTQFCFPARYKGIHILSENKMLNFIWMMIYPFLTSKLKKRIFLHGEDLRPLTEFIHPSVLPEEFGGKAPRFDNTNWADILNNRVETIMNMLNYGYKN